MLTAIEPECESDEGYFNEKRIKNFAHLLHFILLHVQVLEKSELN